MERQRLGRKKDRTGRIPGTGKNPRKTENGRPCRWRAQASAAGDWCGVATQRLGGR